MNSPQPQVRRTANRRIARAANAVLVVAAVGLATSVPAFATSRGPSNALRDATARASARKSPYSIIASGAVKVVIVVNRGLNAKHDRISTFVTTNTTTISELRSKVNDLPPARTGVYFCPADFGASLTLRFFRAGATTPYAVVVADPGGCGSVMIRDYDAMDALMHSTYVSGGAALGSFVAKKFHIKTLEVI
ncbi:MAG: hypothetical protein WAM64_10270 [Acidimicrobiales bacterium]